MGQWPIVSRLPLWLPTASRALVCWNAARVDVHACVIPPHDIEMHAIDSLELGCAQVCGGQHRGKQPDPELKDHGGKRMMIAYLALLYIVGLMEIFNIVICGQPNQPLNPTKTHLPFLSLVSKDSHCCKGMSRLDPRLTGRAPGSGLPSFETSWKHICEVPIVLTNQVGDY